MEAKLAIIEDDGENEYVLFTGSSCSVFPFLLFPGANRPRFRPWGKIEIRPPLFPSVSLNGPLDCSHSQLFPTFCPANHHLFRFVSSLLESGDGAWIGLNDRRTESDYIWNNDVNEEARYFSWAENEPSNTNVKCNIENCVEMKYPNLKWNDMVCNGYNSYVCQVDQASANGNY